MPSVRRTNGHRAVWRHRNRRPAIVSGCGRGRYRSDQPADDNADAAAGIVGMLRRTAGELSSRQLQVVRQLRRRAVDLRRSGAEKLLLPGVPYRHPMLRRRTVIGHRRFLSVWFARRRRNCRAIFGYRRLRLYIRRQNVVCRASVRNMPFR